MINTLRKIDSMLALWRGLELFGVKGCGGHE